MFVSTISIAFTFFLVQLSGPTYFGVDGAPNPSPNPKGNKGPPTKDKENQNKPSTSSDELERLEKQIISRIKGLPKSKLVKIREQATRKLQHNMVQILENLASKNSEAPDNVRAKARSLLPIVKTGHMTSSLNAALPTMLKNYNPASHQENAAGQMQNILRSTMGQMKTGEPQARVALQGMFDTLGNNLRGVNALLGKTMSGTPDLLGGVVKSIAGTSAGATDAVIFSVAGIGPLVGGLLSIA